jgi:hypothetical protein
MTTGLHVGAVLWVSRASTRVGAEEDMVTQEQAGERGQRREQAWKREMEGERRLEAPGLWRAILGVIRRCACHRSARAQQGPSTVRLRRQYTYRQGNGSKSV